MSGESNLAVLIRSMTPQLFEEPYGIICINSIGTVEDCFALIKEDEAYTLIAKRDVLEERGHHVTMSWARITLQIHSSLEAVGLTAAFAAALGNVGISANVVAAFHHDHIFVQWDKRHDALQALITLSNNS